MSLIIATGSNIGESLKTLAKAKNVLQDHFEFIAASRVYSSRAVDYIGQPDFFNQVLEFKLPSLLPLEVMNQLLEIEKLFGRTRETPKGPRTLDLDIIFWDQISLNENGLIIPHPRWIERSFVVRPLSELPFFKSIEKCFTIPKSFDVEASPVI